VITDGGFRLLPIVLLAVVLGVTCEGPSPSPLDPGGRLSGAVVRDGIEYRAEVLVMESFPVQLSGRATLRNRSDQPRTVTFADGCLVLLRAFRPQGGGPVWDQGHDVACTQALVPVELEPGAARELSAPTVSAYDILRADLPDGDYRIALYLRPVDAPEIEIDAGTTDLAIPR
jgi:hypothetical protein